MGLSEKLPIWTNIVTPGGAGNASGELFYWKCWENEDHPSYPMAVYARTGPLASGCPYCSGRYATSENNLRRFSTKHADMFDRAKNISAQGELLTSDIISPYSGVKYDWVCQEGHFINKIAPDELVRKKQYHGCNECRRIAIKNQSHKFAHQKYDHSEIISYYKAGKTYEQISNVVGCSLGHVGRIIARHKREKEKGTIKNVSQSTVWN